MCESGDGEKAWHIYMEVGSTRFVDGLDARDERKK